MINYRIAGIPCLISIISITGRYRPAKIDADPDSCYPAEYPDVEFEVCDRRGRKADWLAAKMTDKEEAEITDLILKKAKDEH